MKSVFLAGSRSCSVDLEDAYMQLKQDGISVTKGRDSIQSTNEQEAHRTMMQRIDHADIVYVVAVNGYVGKTVAFEIGYAAARGKEIIASEQLTERGLMACVANVKTIAQLIAHVRRA